MTTADILLHMSGFELHYDRNAVINSGRLERMASHLLHQKNMYPLYPAHQDICIDYVLLEQHGILNAKPHILILPSTMKTFVKDIDDCLIINPEKLTKGFNGGTFARIEIAPGSNKSICDRASVQILRV
ncbi:unnamed protein product [Psylliodes chrysocephalus]|uniref:DNA polymerase alpha subunit B n=1 Tax=Psylliodes chrysocephalus TaxID=3402493 RepID=A0A9P0G525_9CUCU|nr:unnamed protein product [Psylliodes chrysocephala]